MLLGSQKASKGISGQGATVIPLDGYYYEKKKNNLKVRTIGTPTMHQVIFLFPKFYMEVQTLKVLIFRHQMFLNNSCYFVQLKDYP